MNSKVKDVLEAGKRNLKDAYEKGNNFMDAVPLLKSKRGKLIVWLCMAGVVLVAICRMFGGTEVGSRGVNEACSDVADVGGHANFDSAPLGAESPEAVVMQYYKAYKEGNPVAYLNCVNYTEDEKLAMIGMLSEKMNAKDWCEQARITYAEIKYECEELRPYDADIGGEWATANAFVKASSEWEGSSKSSGRTWRMKKIGGKWFIDKESDSGTHYMGLTDLSSPFPTKPGSTSF